MFNLTKRGIDPTSLRYNIRLYVINYFYKTEYFMIYFCLLLVLWLLRTEEV